MNIVEEYDILASISSSGMIDMLDTRLLKRLNDIAPMFGCELDDNGTIIEVYVEFQNKERRRIEDLK